MCILVPTSIEAKVKNIILVLGDEDEGEKVYHITQLTYSAKAGFSVDEALCLAEEVDKVLFEITNKDSSVAVLDKRMVPALIFVTEVDSKIWYFDVDLLKPMPLRHSTQITNKIRLVNKV